MLLQIILLILGFVLLIKGAGWLVVGASTIAKKYNISDLAIGLTIVAFGTSAPELVVNIVASLQNHQDIVLGNIIGSNNFNLFIILGLSGLITPLIVQSSTVWKEIPISFIAAAMLFLLGNDFISSRPELNWIDGLLFLIMFAFFLFYVYTQLKTVKVDENTDKKKTASFREVGLLLIGFAGLILGGNLIVNNAVRIATLMGVSEKIIGLTIVAIGTSLPELATSLVAAFKKNVDIAVGNIIGSNIFNIFFVLGVSVMIHPISFNEVFNADIYLLLVGTIFLYVAMFTGKKKILDRWEAIVLLLSFLLYTGYLITKETM